MNVTLSTATVHVTMMLITRKAHANYMNRLLLHVLHTMPKTTKQHTKAFSFECQATKTQLHISVFLFETIGAILLSHIYTSSDEVGATELNTQQVNFITNVHSTKIVLQMHISNHNNYFVH